ncbi:ABC transporter permease [Marinactinospora thermotolerans]|uniref:ABC-2 type transport system permease protein n=1 Tax=Marinactinospora thermotolerans DSM 45154 TaxID=1122192 RepID=A0A1T4TB24_9ACTN|nr:ABC transporter permease [Marinactinospora thermotolerans]SKA37596.1 ABC-2 type transport system permease protein [Marinactinospora thermotolerans DSM 45154]
MVAPTTPSPRSQTAAPRPPRRPVGLVRQMLRLTRTEFVLFYRYRMALYVAVLPVVFLLPSFNAGDEELLPGVSAGAFSLASTFAMIAMTVGVIHVSNVYAARREQLVLKRFRVSGVRPAALFGATTLSVFGVVFAQSLIVVALLALQYDVLPADPVLLLISIVLSTVIMSLFGAVITRFARNAESAQMISMIPFMLLLAVSGFFVPLDAMPDGLQHALGLLPMVPAVDIARSAYFGHDFFGGVEGAGELGFVDLWIAAGPSLLVLVAWTAIMAYLVRFMPWDPRQGK